MGGTQSAITLLEFKHDQDQEGFVLNPKAESLFKIDSEAYDMQPFATICIFGTQHSQNHTRIQVLPTPVDVMDKHGTNIKAYIMYCQCDSEDEDVRNSFIAL